MDERDLKALLTLQVVAATGGFASAARELQTTRAAVSRNIGEAERRLGVRLCRRTTRSVALTDAAQALLEQAVPHLQALRDVLAALPDQGHGLRGVIRVSSSHAFGRVHLLPAVAAFQQEHPDVRFEVRLNDAIDDLVVGGFDVALRIGELPDSSLVARRLGRIPVALVATREMVRGRRPRTLADLHGWPVVSFRPPGSGQRRNWTVFESDGGVSVLQTSASAIEVDSVEAIVDLVRAGAGIGLVPRYLVEADMNVGRLVEILPKAAFRGPEVHVCYAHRELVPPRVRRFLEVLVEAIGPRLA